MIHRANPSNEPRWRRRALAATLAAVCGIVGGRAAEANDPHTVERRERCAIRLAVALTGEAPDDALFGAVDPQREVDRLLARPSFRERFARFANTSFNPRPGAAAGQDAVYYVARRVLDGDRPWREVFVGGFGLLENEDGVTVQDDPSGLGYFGTDPWRRRYAGNEAEGVRIIAAYRILRNTVGLELAPVTVSSDEDNSAKGREAAACRGCHYESWYALDKVAAALDRRVGYNEEMTFEPPAGGPQRVLDGQEVANEKELVGALVASEAYVVAQCRLAFSYLHGRPENACEGAIFDACVDALKGDGTMRAGVRAIATHPLFCE
jgi:hypothetical protein